MTSYDCIHSRGNNLHLARHLGNPDTTLVVAERRVVPYPNYGVARGRRPDLLIAFEVNPAAYEASNGYIIMCRKRGCTLLLLMTCGRTWAGSGRPGGGRKRPGNEPKRVSGSWKPS